MKLIVNMLIVSFILFACGDTNNESKTNTENLEENVVEEESIEEMVVEDEEQYDEDMEGSVTEIVHVSLELNNGEKWMANAETSEGMLMIQMLIKNFYELDSDARDYASLTKEIENQCNYIIKNCTMTGKAHDLLHEVLHPILEQLTAAKEADTSGSADANLITIKDLVNEYFKYFEVEADPT